MLAWLMLCTLDSRQYPTLPEITGSMKRVEVARGNAAVLFFLNFPVAQVAPWRAVLQKTFSEAQGYEHVQQYYVDDVDPIDLT